MSLEIGRQGYVGLAIESVSGTPEASPTTFIPFTENTIVSKHEPVLDIAARASRTKDYNAVVGKKWAEGDLALYVDASQSGYLLKLALGQEAMSTVTGNIREHLFYPTVSGNSPTSATLWVYRGDDVDVNQHAFGVVDTLSIQVDNGDEPGVISASVMAKNATAVAAPTLTTTSGNIFTFKDMTVQFGANYVAALAASATKIQSFSLELANNMEGLYRSGSNTPDTFIMGELEVTGEYTVYLENDTEVDAYNNLDKRCVVVTFAGAGIGSGYTERLQLIMHKAIIEDHSPAVGLDEVMAITQSFRCIQSTNPNPGFFEVRLRNLKTTAY